MVPSRRPYGNAFLVRAFPRTQDAATANLRSLIILFLGRIHAKKGLRSFCSKPSATDRITKAPDLHLVFGGPDNGSAASRSGQKRLGRPEPPHDYGLKFGTGSPHGPQPMEILVSGSTLPGMLYDDREVGCLLTAARHSALPSHQENFGIAVAEALACGKPVLISDKVNIWKADSHRTVPPL